MSMKPPFPAGTISEFKPGTPNFKYSNFSGYSVRFGKYMFMTSEHAYQAAKDPDNEDYQHRILAAGTAAEAKKLGNTCKLRADWDQVKVGIMLDLIRQKFATGLPISKDLVATGDVPIIEGNYWHDQTWGQCYCPRHQWEGQNLLGKILMHRRKELKDGNILDF